MPTVPSTEMGGIGVGAQCSCGPNALGRVQLEDSILISERVVKEDIYTSIHIEEFECVSRDTSWVQKKLPATFLTSAMRLSRL